MGGETRVTKQGMLESLLEESMVLVTLDARVEGVDVPGPLRADPQLRLNLSYRFGLPMETDDRGVYATLTFGGIPYDCHLPWSSIYMMTPHASKQPVIFPSDIPRELGAPSEKCELSLVSGDCHNPGEEEAPPPDESARSRGHLRVVK